MKAIVILLASILVLSCSKEEITIINLYGKSGEATVETVEVSTSETQTGKFIAHYNGYSHIQLDEYRYFEGTVKVIYNDTLEFKRNVSVSSPKIWVLILKGRELPEGKLTIKQL